MSALDNVGGPSESVAMSRDHADVVAPPPLVYVPPLAAGILLHFMWEPLRFFPNWWIGHAVGWPVIAASVLLAIWAVRTMARGGEDLSVYKPTNAIISTGPFAFSRNPMYLPLTLLSVGIALVVNTVWPVVLLPGALIFMHYGVIRREEQYLLRLFGDQYRQYQARVRRWI